MNVKSEELMVREIRAQNYIDAVARRKDRAVKRVVRRAEKWFNVTTLISLAIVISYAAVRWG